MSRRRILLASAGAAAVAAGAGVSWWRRPPAPAAPLADSLWSLSFDAPSGPPVQLASLRGKPLLLNFWATWCPPCVKEMPMLDAFQRAHRDRGWQVLGLAVDGPTPVRDFLARQPVGFPIGLAGLEGSELSRTLGNTQGGLPFSVVFDKTGTVAVKQLGALTQAMLDDWATRFSA